MKIDRIKISKEFNVLGLGQWVSLRAKIDDTDNPISSLEKLDKIIDEFIGISSNGKKVIQVGSSYDIHTNDPEFDEFKEKLNQFTSKEDAVSFMLTTNFR